MREVSSVFESLSHRTLLRSTANLVGGAVDRLFVHAAFRSHGVGRRATRASIGPRLQEASQLYPEADVEGRLFVEPEPARLEESRIARLRRGEIVDLQWPSQYRPLHQAYADVLARCPENMIACARWYRHTRPSPLLICLHGWGGGFFRVEALVSRADWFFRSGFDVVLVTAPFHARRAPAKRRLPMFPTTDAVRSTEGFAQAVSDLRALIAALRLRQIPSIGVSGMSLGGFTSVLLATVEESVQAVIPIATFSSMPALMWEHGAKTRARARAEESGLTLERYSQAFTTIEPLQRTPKVSGDRMLFIAGEFDRVCPVVHARRLADHFPGAGVKTFPGSHFVHVGRGGIFTALKDFLIRLGFQAR